MSGFDELRAFFRRMPVAFYRTDTTGRVIAANPALASLLGYESVEELTDGMNSVESVYVDPSCRALWLERMAKEGVVLDFDVELRRADGTTFWVRDTARAIRDDAGDIQYYEGALIDVTDKFTAQSEKDEFIATISHELRNPLAAMLGLGSELADHYETFTDEERREVAQLISRQAEDASWLIEDLLVAYRDDLDHVKVSLETLDVVKEVERVLEVVDQPIEVKSLDSHPQIHADPQRSRQILRNLVSNAQRYGGDQIQVSVVRAGDRIEIRVEDSGDPIPDGDVDRIFKPYERGANSAHPKSVGLGLSVARRLARLMDGDLTYRHQQGWSTFVLSLPSA